MNALATLKAVLVKAWEILCSAARAARAWIAGLSTAGLPKLRLTPIVNAVEAVAGPAVEGISAAAGIAVRAETRKPRFALDAGLAVGGALVVLALVFGLYLHGYHKGEDFQATVAAAWQERATSAAALANENAAAAARLQKAEVDLAAEVDRHAHDSLASDARYAQALDAARKATESERSARVACRPAGKGDGPAGNAPMTQSMRDALGVLRKGEHQ